MKSKIQNPISTQIHVLRYPKRLVPQIFLNLIFLSSISFAWAEDLFNPEPEILECPDDMADSTIKRLTINSDGKTPVVKNLNSAWIKSLTQRGEPKIYTKDNSKTFNISACPSEELGQGNSI